MKMTNPPLPDLEHFRGLKGILFRIMWTFLMLKYRNIFSSIPRTRGCKRKNRDYIKHNQKQKNRFIYVYDKKNVIEKTSG